MKYEFASAEWAAAMHACIAQRIASGGPNAAERRMSICEVFQNAPPHLAGKDGNVAWSCVVTDGVIDFRRAERDDVEIKIVTDYAATLPVARFDTEGKPERAREMQAMSASHIKAGLMKVLHNARPAPETPPAETPGPSIHDLMARLTR